jgi:hypothetical protein
LRGASGAGAGSGVASKLRFAVYSASWFFAMRKF